MNHQQIQPKTQLNTKNTFYQGLEAECKNMKVQFLKFNPLKAAFCTLILTASVVGLLFLKYFKKLRIKAFYSSLETSRSKATHVYVVDEDGSDEICGISEKGTDSRKAKVFCFKHLQFEVNEEEISPLMLNYRQNLEFYLNHDFLAHGSSEIEAKKRGLFYGRNEHKVEIPNYFEYLFEVMSKPFFIFQYIAMVVYIFENIAVFGIATVSFSFITTSINYLLLRRSYMKIKQTAEKQFTVKVLRDSKYYEIKNTDLVPGDLYKPQGEIPCDSLILKGNLFVNQVLLTGEDMPIAKTQLSHKIHSQKYCHWLFEGSNIENAQSNTQVFALAINVGFATRRGRIIRKILTKVPKQPQFFNKLIFFLLQVLLLSAIAYFATLKYLMSFNIDKTMIILRFLSFIVWSIPDSLPVFFNLFYSFALVRLNRKGIFGVQPQKTVQSGHMKTLCFDKTGTLTQKKVQITKIYQIQSDGEIIILNSLTFGNALIADIFGCCNSVQVIEGKPKGDVIDIEMFTQSHARINAGKREGAIREISVQNRSYDVLRINQYQSKFQSMSVLVRLVQKLQTRYYVFAKGSPELMAQHSQHSQHSQQKHPRLDSLTKEISLEGYRSLAIGYREVSEAEMQHLLKEDRRQFLENMVTLALVTFVNSLKEDARETLETLSQCEIDTKMITGDNIYLAVRTAVNVGIIPQSTTITVLQGRKFVSLSNSGELVHLFMDKEGGFRETTEKVTNFSFQDRAGFVYAVDNDFINNHKNEDIHSKVKVFARISPENKAYIVKKYKQVYQKERDRGSRFSRIFRDCRLKIGMVGDGANDLIAIKEADVGIGLEGTDAVYSASFGIKNLSQIIQVIKEAKNTEMQIIQLVQYLGFTQIVGVVITLILTRDLTYLTSLQLFYKNFVCLIPISLFFGLSRSSSALTKYFTQTNFMSRENQLVYLGNIVIYGLAFAISYEYYYRSEDFAPNPFPYITFQSGIYGKTKSATVVFLCLNVSLAFLPLCVYRSKPWKQPFYKNIALTVIIALNIILALSLFFTTNYLSFINVQPIALKQSCYVLGIMIVGTLVCYLFNLGVQRFYWRARKAEDEERREKLELITKESQ